MNVQSVLICSRCGTALGPDVPEGLCPRCLLGLNLEQPTGASQLGPHGTAVLPDRPPAPPLDELAKHFPQLEILAYLGRGGMGVVYKARQVSLNRLVALKLIVPERKDDASFAERFLREAQALAHLSHPNIVTVHDFGQAKDLYYLVMEFVDGVSLRELLKDGKLAPEQAMTLVPKICEALQYAHEKGVVHRDIKPENLLLDRHGAVKIADFGIAKVLGSDRREESRTAEKQVIGTPHYMAPEQVENPQQVDHRADIYSLGVVFYEMLTGELPLGKFQAPSRKAQMDARLDEVVLKALEKEPERRYQHASDVKKDVETIATSAPPDANRSDVSAGHLRSTLTVIAIVICSIIGGIGVERRSLATGLICLSYLVVSTLALFGLNGFRRPAMVADLARWTSLALMIAAGVTYGVGIGARSSVTQFIAAAAMIGAALGLSGAFQRFRRVNASEARLHDGVSRAVPMVRWIARVLGTTLLVFYGIFIVAEGLPAIGSAPTGVQLNFAALGLMLAGYIVGWGRDGTAAVLITSGWALWQLSEGAIRWNLFQTPIPVAALYAWCWWADHRRNSGRVLTLAAVLVVLLVIGLGSNSLESFGRVGNASSAVLTLDGLPPVVIRTEPASGSTGVDPQLREIKVTFSKQMQPGGWSWVRASEGSDPQRTGAPQFLPDHRTCVLPVQLNPGQTCAVWINTPQFANFRDEKGNSAVPYLLIFETRPQK